MILSEHTAKPLSLVLCLLFLSPLGLLVASCSQKDGKASAVTAESEKQAVIAAVNEAYLAGQRGDLEALAAGHLYGPGFTRFDEGQRINAEQTRQMEEAFFSAPDNGFKFEVIDPLVDLVAEDVAVATYFLHWSARFQGHDYVSRDQITFVMKKQDGRWLIAHENFAPLEGYPEVTPAQ